MPPPQRSYPPLWPPCARKAQYPGHEKYYNKQKITYEEYVFILATNDEIYFLYANDEYQIVYDSSESVSMCITEFKGTQKVSGRSESFSSIIELLDKFRIEGKRIRDIWDEVTF